MKKGALISGKNLTQLTELWNTCGNARSRKYIDSTNMSFVFIPSSIFETLKRLTYFLYNKHGDKPVKRVARVFNNT
ncbi:hypothetical protein HI914_03916 [Erysiphe necator]|nr:hypothetical protein HI914_03916 [Erysiphe necator]